VRVDFATALSSGDRVRLGDSTVLRFFLVDDEEERAMRESFEQARRDALAARLQELPERDDTLRDELEAAGEFQRRALTPPASLPGLTVDVMYRPLDVVGGDLFHVAPLAGGGARVFLADATGHGIRASLSMMLILSEYETARHAEDPAGVLAALNQRFTSAHGHLGVRFTAICADLDAKASQVRLATAAHPAPWLVRGGSPTELETGGPFVGLSPDMDFPVTVSELRPGDLFLAFTDGLTETFDDRGDACGEFRLVEACAGAKPGNWAQAVETTLDRFRGERPLDDDAMLLCVAWSGA
jgi:phosphoserine phosphatase RsbU/P